MYADLIETGGFFRFLQNILVRLYLLKEKTIAVKLMGVMTLSELICQN